MKKNISIKINAFTLVELLVVIAIISVLAGMLMPALENAIGSARSISCLNTQKQLVMADISYSESNDGYLCADLAYGNTWSYYLREYYAGKGTGFFSVQNPVVCPENPYQYANNGGYHYHNYAINLRTRIDGTPESMRFRKLTSVNKPSEAALFGDSTLRSGFKDGKCVNYYMMWTSSQTEISTSYVSTVICLGHFIHNGGMNIGFLDGHAEHATIGDVDEYGARWFDFDD